MECSFGFFRFGFLVFGRGFESADDGVVEGDFFSLKDCPAKERSKGLDMGFFEDDLSFHNTTTC